MYLFFFFFFFSNTGKTVEYIKVPLQEDEQILYDITQGWLTRQFDKETTGLSYTHRFVLMLRCRQICLHWSLVLKGLIVFI